MMGLPPEVQAWAFAMMAASFASVAAALVSIGCALFNSPHTLAASTWLLRSGYRLTLTPLERHTFDRNQQRKDGEEDKSAQRRTSRRGRRVRQRTSAADNLPASGVSTTRD